MSDSIKRFNIRVYGLLLKEQKVLLSDEFRLGMRMTKFPGGGLEFGEGTIDALKREFKEELGAEVSETTHFYTTDYFQPTYLLQEAQQLICIYYLVQLQNREDLKVSDCAFDYGEDLDGAQSFRWVSVSGISESIMTFPIDKKVAVMLREKMGS